MPQDLHAARINATKREIVRAELNNAAYRADALPDDVKQSSVGHVTYKLLMLWVAERACRYCGCITG